VKQYFDRNKSEFGSSESAAQVAADALCVGLATVNRVMASYRKYPVIITQKFFKSINSFAKNHKSFNGTA
jgi:hypothetical protein